MRSQGPVFAGARIGPGLWWLTGMRLAGYYRVVPCAVFVCGAA